MILQTERLCLRKWQQEDFADLAEMLQDPQVMYAYEHGFSDADVQEWMERQWRRYREHGFGLWAVVEKQSGDIVGQAGLTIQHCEGQDILEIGYHLKRKHWKKGYAAEAAKGCMQYAFEVLGAPAVYSVIKSDNLASQKVAERMGMKKQKEFWATYYAGPMLHFLYGREKPNKQKEEAQ
ncbi:GNAT family N-acetyltransferase [Christensenellaceae bacterium 44-20]